VAVAPAFPAVAVAPVSPTMAVGPLPLLWLLPLLPPPRHLAQAADPVLSVILPFLPTHKEVGTITLGGPPGGEVMQISIF